MCCAMRCPVGTLDVANELVIVPSKMAERIFLYVDGLLFLELTVT